MRQVIYLRNDATQRLLEEPETGMGYQLVRASRYEGDFLALVLNGYVLIELDEWQRLHEAYPPEVISEVAEAPFIEIEEVFDRSQLAEAGLAPAPPALEGLPSPVLAPVDPHEGFHRFSFFDHDRRIGPDGAVRPGTYVAPIRDARSVLCGLTAVARYALPDPRPARHVYTIVPNAVTSSQMGTVAPAFGQSGGGVEVFLDRGVGEGSALPRPFRIPER